MGKQIETNEEQGRKQIDATANQNERLAASSNKDDHEDNDNEILEELVEESFNEIK